MLLAIALDRPPLVLKHGRVMGVGRGVVEHVWQKLQVSPDEARRRIRATFSVLRDAVTLGEFDDVFSQLDREYAMLIS